MFSEKAKEFFASNKDAKGVCVTSDGTIFDLENWQFADAHAQTLEQKQIEIHVTDESVLNDRLKRLFVEGSIWVLKLVAEKIIDAIENKIENRPKKARTK